MKILVAGDCHSELHEEAVCKAFKELGHEVLKFGWHDYFKPTNGFIDRLRKRFKTDSLPVPLSAE